MSGPQKHLFLGGLSRSGTTALGRVLNAHNKIVLGVERFFFLFKNEALAPEHFEKARFFSIEEGDTHKAVLSQFKNGVAEAKYDSATYVGDKLPKLYNYYDYIGAKFPKAQIVYIVRNPLSVAESFQARHENPEKRSQFNYRDAVAEWNKSLEATHALIAGGRDVIVVSYEKVFSSADSIARLFEALGLAPDDVDQSIIDESVAGFAELNAKKVARREDIRRYVAEKADFGAYRKLLRKYDLLEKEKLVLAAAEV